MKKKLSAKFRNQNSVLPFFFLFLFLNIWVLLGDGFGVIMIFFLVIDLIVTHGGYLENTIKFLL